MKNNTFEEIWKKMKSCKRVIMKLHENPDGDSLGSCAAMKYVLEKEGKEVKLISKDFLSENLREFDFSKEVEFEKDLTECNLKDFDAVVLLDHGDLSYTNNHERVKEMLKGNFVINIDHHSTNDYFGDLNYVGKSSSCCAVLLDFFRHINIKFDKELSIRLLVGICTDTHFFLHGDSIKNMEDAVFLLKSGKVNYESEVYEIINNNPWNLKKLQGIILTNMKKVIIDNKVVAYSWATKREHEKQGFNESNIKLGITCMQDIKGVDLIFVLTELDGGIRGSFRSKEFDTTVYSLALGGGGHKQASGFMIEKTNIKKAIRKVFETVKEKGFIRITETE